MTGIRLFPSAETSGLWTTRNRKGREVCKFVIVVSLLLREFGPFLSNEVAKERNSVFLALLVAS